MNERSELCSTPANPDDDISYDDFDEYAGHSLQCGWFRISVHVASDGLAGYWEPLLFGTFFPLQPAGQVVTNVPMFVASVCQYDDSNRVPKPWF